MLEEICPSCARNREIEEPIIFKLLYLLNLQKTLEKFGTQLDRHELTNDQWMALPVLKAGLDAIKEKNSRKHGTESS